MDDRLAHIAQRVGEQRPIRIREVGSDVTARKVSSSSRDVIHEVRCRHIELPQARIKTLERLRAIGGQTR